MNIALVVHGLPPAALGGTEIYTDALARALASRSGDAVHVLAREARSDLPERHVRRETRGAYAVTWVNNTFADARRFEDTYRDPLLSRLAAGFLDETRPDVLHVQHLTGLSTDVVLEAHSRTIPCVVTLNDYWLYCQRGQLLDRELARCDGPTPAGCARCFGLSGSVSPRLHRLAPFLRRLDRRLPRLGLNQAAVALAGIFARRTEGTLKATERLEHVRTVVKNVRLFLAPSRRLRDRFVGFGVDPGRIVFAEQGIDLAPFRDTVRTTSTRLRIGFIGSLLVSKAPHLLLEAFATLDPARAELSVHGDHAAYHGDDRYRETLRPLLARRGVRWNGAMPHAAVATVLANLDVLVVPSRWEENAPFVIREAFAAGVPVVAARIGGIPEMVRDEVDGLLFQPDDAADLGRALRRLMDEPGLLSCLRGGVRAGRSIEDDARATREIYASLIGPAPRPIETGSDPGWRGLAAVVLNYRTPLDTLLAVRSLSSAIAPPQDVIVVDNASGDGSLAWLRERLPGRTFLEAPANLGFSGGVNLGLRHALAHGASRVFLLNSDALVARDTLTHLSTALDRDPGAGIAGPVVLDRSDPRRVASLGLSLSPLTGRLRHRGFGMLTERLDLSESVPSDAVSGCAMLVRSEVFERIGLFDEAYFFGFEDIELCVRTRAAGMRVILVPAAIAYHGEGLTIGPHSPRRIYYATRNHLRLSAVALPDYAPGHRLARVVTVTALNLAHALVTADVPRAAALAAFARGLSDHRRGRYGRAPDDL